MTASPRSLIILNYQRCIPPFMQMEITEARKFFDQVYYITRKLTDDNRATVDFPNVHIIEISGFTKKSQFLLSPLKGAVDELSLEMYHNFTPKLAAIYFTGYFCARCLYLTAETLVSKLIEQSNDCYVLASWMSQEATAASWLKRKFPSTKAFSFAHSFEVIPERNPFIHCCSHMFHHKWLDKVYFISSKVKERYLETMVRERIKETYGNRIGVRHLGSSKTNNLLNPTNYGEEFQIVTCSRIDENKRLGRIVEILGKWTGRKIHWSIIGDGVLRPEVEENAKKLMRDNPKIKVSFLGQLSNADVQVFYQKNPVDLFINVSRSEGLPVSIMEAISYGIPALATDVGGTSEIVLPNSGTLLSQNFSDEELIIKLEKFANMDQVSAQELRSGAFQLWENEFNIHKTSKQMYSEWFNA